MKSIAVLVGSLSASSINMAFAKALEKIAEPRLRFDFVDIGALPHYNNDLWDSPPAAVLELKSKIETASGVLIVTPEHNRSIPGVLKNAIDWASRPWGQSSWSGKPVALVGTTPGATGTSSAQSHLRSVLPMLEVLLLGQPEVYLQYRPGLIDEHHEVTDEQTRAFLAGFVDRFDELIERHGAPVAHAVAAE
jgi:Predicted flavoprotein